jgi:F0F1-type ATP synthase delta subunit
MDQIDFSEFFSTKAEANDFLSSLTAVIDKIFQTDFHIQKALSDHFGINKSDRLISIMRENTINTESRENVKLFLQKIHDAVAALPVLSITIAFEPQEKTLKALSEWFLINMKKQVVFDFTVDRKVVAGATLNYNGKFFDFSIRPVVERILQMYTQKLTKPETKQVLAEQPVHQRVQDISMGR